MFLNMAAVQKPPFYCRLLLFTFVTAMSKDLPPSIHVTTHNLWTGINVTCHPTLTSVEETTLNSYPVNVDRNEGSMKEKVAIETESVLNRFIRNALLAEGNDSLIADDSTINLDSTSSPKILKVPSVLKSYLINKKNTDYKKEYVKHKHRDKNILKHSAQNDSITSEETKQTFSTDDTTELKQNLSGGNGETSADSILSKVEHSKSVELKEVANLQEGIISGSKDIQLKTWGCGRTVLQEGSVSGQVHHLTITTEGSVVLGNNWANKARYLQKLRILASNGLTGISVCNWWPLDLRELDLSHMPLEYLNLSGCTSPPASVSTLVVVGTNLSSIHLCAPALSMLDVSWNYLNNNSVQATCERGLSGVQELHISHNNLAYWSSCSWDHITFVDVSNNQIENIDLGSCPTDFLKVLRAPHNHIKEFNEPFPESLTILNLNHNKLSSLPKISLTLKEAYFSHNVITTISHNTLKDARRVLKLDLSHNLLSVLYNRDFSGLTEVRELDLSHNKLHHLAAGVLAPLHQLKVLRLQYNQLSEVDPRQFSKLPANLHVTLHHNPWKCACQLLALLQQASTAHCHQHCKLRDLQCEESGKLVEVSEVLNWCLRIMKDIRSGDKVDDEDSDEEDDDDLSLEDLSPTERVRRQQELDGTYAMAVPGVLVLLCILVVGVLVHRGYKRRRKLKRLCPLLESYCDCLAPTNPMPAVSALDDPIHDVESDTEMSRMTTRMATTDL